MPGQPPGGSDDLMRAYEKPTLTALNLPGARAEDPVPEGVCKSGSWVGDAEWGVCWNGSLPNSDISCGGGMGPTYQRACGTGIEAA